MGLLPALRREGYRIEEIRIEDARGRRSGGFKVRTFRHVLHDRYVSILRSDLAKLIYQSLQGKVRTISGDTVTRIEQDDEAVRVTFAQAPPERFDLLVGAGGLHSPVRALVFGREERYENYLGYYAASFSVRGYPHSDPGAYVSFASRGLARSRAIHCVMTGQCSFLSSEVSASWLSDTMTPKRRWPCCGRCSGSSAGNVQISSRLSRGAPTFISIP